MKTTDFQKAVQEVYAAGATLYVDTLGKISVDGEIPKETKKYIRGNKEQIRLMLTGDPLIGFGWEGRTALFDQALRWLDEKTKTMGEDAYDRAVGALTSRVSVYDRLNEGWRNPDIEVFRRALRDYVRVGLDAAKEKKSKVKVRG